jgi:hypothetical protein
MRHHGPTAAVMGDEVTWGVREQMLFSEESALGSLQGTLLRGARPLEIP